MGASRKLGMLVVVLCLFSIAPLWSQQSYLDTKGYVPPEGFVPNETTAIKVAQAVLETIYGKKDLDFVQPLKAELVNQTLWVVRGSLPKGTLGGTPYIEIQKSDGKVLKVVHSR